MHVLVGGGGRGVALVCNCVCGPQLHCLYVSCSPGSVFLVCLCK